MKFRRLFFFSFILSLFFQVFFKNTFKKHYQKCHNSFENNPQEKPLENELGTLNQDKKYEFLYNEAYKLYQDLKKQKEERGNNENAQYLNNILKDEDLSLNFDDRNKNQKIIDNELDKKGVKININLNSDQGYF